VVFVKEGVQNCQREFWKAFRLKKPLVFFGNKEKLIFIRKDDQKTLKGFLEEQRKALG